jgi:hypothetical protein
MAETVSGVTSPYQVDTVRLGPSTGVNGASSGVMFFDEFSSERLNGLQFSLFLPVINQ